MPTPARRRRAASLLLLGTGLLLSGCGLYPADSGSSGSADDGPLTLDAGRAGENSRQDAATGPGRAEGRTLLRDGVQLGREHR